MKKILCPSNESQADRDAIASMRRGSRRRNTRRPYRPLKQKAA